MTPGPLPSWLSAALEEYKVHQAAVLGLRSEAQQTLTFGGATIGILVAGGVNAWEHRLPATLIFLSVIPLVSCVIGLQWSGQMLLLNREGRYLSRLEEGIRAAHVTSGERETFPTGLFTWERAQRESMSQRWFRPDWRWLPSSAVVSFGIIAAGSLIVGAYRGFHGHGVLVTTVALAEAISLTLIGLVLLWRLGGEPSRPDPIDVHDEPI